MKKLILATGLILSSCASVAMAQSNNCGPRDVVVAHLGTKYQEVVQVSGIASATSFMEVYANKETETWTVVVTNISTGISCLVIAGDNFYVEDNVLPPVGEPL